MAEGTCNVPDCGKYGTIKRGWCHAHYMRWRRHGDVQADLPLRPPLPPGTICQVDGCVKPHYALGYCDTHRARYQKYGNPIAAVPIRPKVALSPVCSMSHCGKPHFARGWCGQHYMRWRIHGDPAVYLYKQPPVACAVAGCEFPTQSLGWCSSHYSRWQRWGDVRADLPFRRKEWAGETCAEQGCNRLVKCRYRCKLHYGQLRASEIRSDADRYAAMRDVRRRYNSAQKARHPGRANARARAWRARNPHAARLLDSRRRRRLLAAPHLPFTAEQLAGRMRYWGDRCWMCKGPYDSVDHVKPISKGGWDALANLRPVCRSCNSRKKDRWPWPVTTR